MKSCGFTAFAHGRCSPASHRLVTTFPSASQLTSAARQANTTYLGSRGFDDAVSWDFAWFGDGRQCRLAYVDLGASWFSRMRGWAGGRIVVAGGVLAGSFRDDANAVLLADLVELFVGCGVIDLAEVVFDAARDGDQEQPGGLVPGPEPVRAAARQEHEAACGGVEGVAAAADGEFAVEHVEALIFTVMDVQRRPGSDRGLEDAQGSARGVLRGLQARIAGHAGAGRKGIAGQEVGHGYMITLRTAGWRDLPHLPAEPEPWPVRLISGTRVSFRGPAPCSRRMTSWGPWREHAPGS